MSSLERSPKSELLKSDERYVQQKVESIDQQGNTLLEWCLCDSDDTFCVVFSLQCASFCMDMYSRHRKSNRSPLKHVFLVLVVSIILLAK